MNFKYNDSVVITNGFYEGMTGTIKGKMMYNYLVQFNDLKEVWVSMYFLKGL